MKITWSYSEVLAFRWLEKRGIDVPLFLILSLCLFSGRASATEPDSGVPKRFKPLIELVNMERCNEAWLGLWKMAKDKDYDALFFLEQSTIMIHPTFGAKSPVDQDKMARLFFPLVFYSARSSYVKANPGWREYLNKVAYSVVEIFSAKVDHIDEIKKCIKSGDGVVDCIELAQKYKIIPEYETYLDDVDMINKSVTFGCNHFYGDLPKAK